MEFIDVNQEDELNSLLHNNNAYADIAISGNEKGIGDSVVGNWVLKQSKVPIENRFIENFQFIVLFYVTPYFLASRGNIFPSSLQIIGDSDICIRQLDHKQFYIHICFVYNSSRV